MDEIAANSALHQQWQGCESTDAVADKEAQEKEWRLRNAIQILRQAREIRADTVLMAEIRERIHIERDTLAALLDDMPAR